MIKYNLFSCYILHIVALNAMYTDTYTFDDNSNRATLNADSYTYDANNRLIEDNNSHSYSYSHSGNTTTDNIYNYTYDGFNRLTQLNEHFSSVTLATYTYNGDGQRITKTVNGVTTTYVWNGDYIVYETTGTTDQKYYYGNVLYAYKATDGNTYYYGYNIHGDVIETYNGTGNVVNEYHYDSFGNRLDLSQPLTDTNPFRYCGEYYDSESGLIYLRNRYYNPQTGRFITEDPIRDGLNWYVYANNNPVMFADPWGLKDVWVREWVEAVGGKIEVLQNSFLGIHYGLKGLKVTIGNKTIEYTNADYEIIDDCAYIDSDMINRDFNYIKLTKNQKEMIATVYGEAASASEESWQAVTSVILNRRGQREWKQYTTAIDVIKNTGFDAYTYKNAPYTEAMEYMNNRDGSNESIENCIRIVMDTYKKQLGDNTNGAVLYYSPKAQMQLYGVRPNWDFDLLTEIKVEGCENDDFKFFKYKN